MRYLFLLLFVLFSVFHSSAAADRVTSDILVHPEAEFIFYAESSFFKSQFIKQAIRSAEQTNNASLHSALSELSAVMDDFNVVFSANISKALDGKGNVLPDKCEWFIGYEYSDAAAAKGREDVNKLAVLSEKVLQDFIQVMKQSSPVLAQYKISGMKADFSAEKTGWFVFKMFMNGPELDDYELLLAISRDCKYAICGQGRAVRKQTVLSWMKQDSAAAKELKRLCDSVNNKQVIVASLSFTDEAIRKLSSFFDYNSSSAMQCLHILERTRRISIQLTPKLNTLIVSATLNFKDAYYGGTLLTQMSSAYKKFIHSVQASRELGHGKNNTFLPCMLTGEFAQSGGDITVSATIKEADLLAAFLMSTSQNPEDSAF